MRLLDLEDANHSRWGTRHDEVTRPFAVYRCSAERSAGANTCHAATTSDMNAATADAQAARFAEVAIAS